jgi:hypothetical protein
LPWLLGLVLFTINTRKKEIGIRKVLGATVANIVAVLSTDVIRLVFIAYFIAVPLAWWATYKWLEEFSYRTPISWWVFIISGVLMLSAALATLSIQIIRAWAFEMLKNYFLTAYRNLLRNRSYAAINVVGLAVGIAACLLIFLVIEFETSFDTFHKKRDRIYRVSTQFNNPDGKGYSAGAPATRNKAMRADFPQLENVGHHWRTKRPGKHS